MEHFFLDCIKIVSLLAFKSHLKCHLLRKAFPYQLFKAILTSPQAQCVTLAYLTILTEFITVMKNSLFVYFCRVNNSPFELLTWSCFCLPWNKSWFFSRSIHLPIRMSSRKVAEKVSADIKLLEVKSQALILRKDYLNSSICFSL